MSPFDLAVIGAGPGGFDAALRARELGFKVALIDKSDPGGTCLNTGCIPAKSLLASTKFLSRMKEGQSLGLSNVTPVINLALFIERKNKIVEGLKKGMTDALKRSGVEWFSGTAKFMNKNKLSVTPSPFPLPGRERVGVKEDMEIESKFVIIAAGSEPTPFPGLPFDGDQVLSSTDALEIKKLPQRLLILGGGVMGVEFASIFQALGVHVTIVEMLDRLIAGEDPEIARRFESLFQRKGIEILTRQKVKTLARQGQGVLAHLESGEKITADQVLVAIGRRPQMESLGLEKAGVTAEKKGILVNEYLETTTRNIFAIGDITSQTTGLAHSATAEGIRVVENLKGQKKAMNKVIPNCIYSDPEVASVGIYQARFTKPAGEMIESKILFSSIAKSQVQAQTEGFLKMTAAKDSGKILGVTAIGAHVTELIHEGVLAIQAGLTVETLAETIHAHPTESEIVQKAAQKLKDIRKGSSANSN